MEHQAKIYKDLGKDYLNAKFGWESFIRDVGGTVGAACVMNRAIKQFLRDSGKTVRRRYDFPTVRQVVKHNVSPRVTITDPGYISRFFDGNSHGTDIDTEYYVQRTWFVAAYTYYIPTGDDFESQRERGERINHKLNGLRIDPDVLYQIAPWSWLLDYFGNMGDAVRNFSAFGHDNLVAKYAYMMCKSEAHREQTWTGIAKSGQTVTTSVNCKTTSYVRARGEAYAFNPSSLTAKQVGILGALGFSRLPTKG
jgi:hypothetical protein